MGYFVFVGTLLLKDLLGVSLLEELLGVLQLATLRRTRRVCISTAGGRAFWGRWGRYWGWWRVLGMLGWDTGGIEGSGGSRPGAGGAVLLKDVFAGGIG